MNLIVHGASGHMGRLLCDLAEQQGHTIIAKVAADFPEAPIPSVPQSSAASLPQPAAAAATAAPTPAAVVCRKFAAIPAANLAAADCVIDFSNHSATGELLSFCVAQNLPLVLATTGQTDDEKVAISNAAQEIPLFFSANMSVGIAVLADLAQRAAAAFPAADIEIVEIHHNRKLDVPSGTALLLAKKIQNVRNNSVLLVGRHENGKRTPQEIGIHSLRLGNEVGTHEILISTGNETLTLTHKAESRALFADGALRAALWLCGKPAGLYNMQDLMEGNTI